MTKDFNQELGQRIKERRLEIGMSQTEVTDLLKKKISQQMLLKYEKGAAAVSVEKLCDIASVLGCTPEAFLMRRPSKVRDEQSFKREGRLVKYFRAIPTLEAQQSIIEMAKEAAKIYDGKEKGASE